MRSIQARFNTADIGFPAGFWPGVAWLLPGYAALAMLGLRWATTNGAASPVWPAAGLAAAGLLMLGPRLWPVVTAATLLALLLAGSPQPWWARALLSLGNGLGAGCAAWLATRLGLHTAFERTRDVLVLCAMAAASAALAASIGAPTLWLSASLPGAAAVQVWIHWFLGDLVGVLTVAPLMLSWRDKKLSRPECGWAVFTGQVLATLLVGAFIFLGHPSRHPLVWLVMVPLMGVALRCDARGVTAAMAGVALLAVGGTTREAGPFSVYGSGEPRYAYLQAFRAVAAVMALQVYAIVRERLQAEASQRQAQRQLERARHDVEAAAATTQAKSAFLAHMSHEIRTPMRCSASAWPRWTKPRSTCCKSSATSWTCPRSKPAS
jgi:integral membrane sensor domain MASE1